MVWIKLVFTAEIVADLSNAGIVWIDNQSWDEDLTNKIFAETSERTSSRILL